MRSRKVANSSSPIHRWLVVTMFEDLDELAKGLAENDISRRQAIRWAGYSVLGASLSSMGFAESAEALSRKARRRCRRKGGTPLAAGDCHCGLNCDAPDPTKFTCQDNPNCRCFMSTGGFGWCGRLDQCANLQECTFSSDCTPQFGTEACVHTCCGDTRCVRVC